DGRWCYPRRRPHADVVEDDDLALRSEQIQEGTIPVADRSAETHKHHQRRRAGLAEPTVAAPSIRAVDGFGLDRVADERTGGGQGFPLKRKSRIGLRIGTP